MSNKVKHFAKRKLLNIIQLIGGAGLSMLIVALLLFLAYILSGCTAADDCVQETHPSMSTGSAVVFAVADSTTRGATRTAQGTMTVDGAAGTVSLKEKGFGVFACHTGTHPYVSTSTTANLLYNQLVSYNDVSGLWTYAPLVYWPNGSTGPLEYVSFFAYGPHSDNAGGCIADMSNPDETGDPWILYQLGGTPDADGPQGWKTNQVDLVYDFKKDQQRGNTPATRISFDFKHALACIGDRITMTCDESVTDRLKAVYTDSPVEFTVTNITVDYLLTRKGRLILNNSTQPNWEAVESEDAKVHRTLSFSSDMVMARATSATEATTTLFDSGAGHGIFYIPIESGSAKQQVTITAQYTISTGVPAEVVEEGSVNAVVDLSFISNASEGRNMDITLRIPNN